MAKRYGVMKALSVRNVGTISLKPVMSSVPGFVWHTHRPCKLSYETRTVVARAVVVARHGADDLVERGDDEDDARRCRSDAGPRPRGALAAAERLRVTRVDAAGADIARGGRFRQTDRQFVPDPGIPHDVLSRRSAR